VKPAFLLADAPPEAEPLPLRLVPAIAAEVAPLTAPVTVPARPTLPLAVPFRRSTEPLAEPFAAPDQRRLRYWRSRRAAEGAVDHSRRRCRRY